MIAEVDVFGVLVGSALVSAVLAWVVLLPLRRVLSWCGFYRWTWHPHLVDVALFVLLWGAATAVLPSLIRSIA